MSRNAPSFAVIVFLLGLTSTAAARAQDAAAAEPATAEPAAAPSTLLPVYAVDLDFDAAAVDGTAYPSKSPAHPHAGTSEVFQQVWSRLKPSGFSAVRFPVDVGEGDAAVYRVANLCAWANGEGVSLLPVLVGGADGPFPEGYDAAAAAFVKKLAETLRAGGADGLAIYPRLLMLQLGNEVNHPARNGRLATDAAAQRVVAAAAAVRKAEQEALEGSGLYLTPILAAASLDAELVAAGAPATVTLGDEAYTQAYGALRAALAPAAASVDVDGVAVSWYPGSVSAGGVERLGALVRSLATDLPGKQLVVVTGLSAAFRPADEQKQFTTLAFTNLAEVRTGAGGDSPLLGVVFHKALGMSASGTPPAGFEEARQAWAPEAMAKDLMALWRREEASPEIAYWDSEVEARMGLLAVEAGPGGATGVASQPALQGLEQVADAVADAPAATGDTTPLAETPPGDTPPADAPGSHPVKEKVGGILAALLDQVLTQLGNQLSNEVNEQIENLGGGGGGSEGGGGGAPLAPPVKITGASCTPASPKVNQQVSCAVNLHNESADAGAANLSVALLDADSYLLGDETSVEGVSLGAGAQTTVTVPWKPGAVGSQQVIATLYDESYAEIGSAPAGAVNVKPASGGSGGSGGLGNLSRFQDHLVAGTTHTSTLLKPAKPGYPNIGVLATTTKTLSADGGSIGLPFANSSKRSMSGFTATLTIDGEKVAEKSVRTLMPGQSHTLVFDQLRMAPGKPHELRVMMSRRGDAPLLVGALRLDASKVTRGPVRTVAATPPRARPVRPTLDAARVGVTPGAVSRTASTPGSTLGTNRTGTQRTTTTTSQQPTTRTTTEARPPSSGNTVPGQRLPPPPRPDLALGTGSVRVSPPSGPPGRTVSVQAVVTNNGTGPSGGAVVSFQVRGARGVAARGSQRLGGVPARGRATASWSFTMPAAGNWRVEATVQSDGDANAANNGAAAEVTSVQPRVVVPQGPVARPGTTVKPAAKPTPKPTGRPGGD